MEPNGKADSELGGFAGMKGIVGFRLVVQMNFLTLLIYFFGKVFDSKWPCSPKVAEGRSQPVPRAGLPSHSPFGIF